MTLDREPSSVELIPLERITILNPRRRNRKGFREIVRNIGQIGLKRPITVTRRQDPDGPRYNLVCGQGRLEAYRALHQSEIPALIIDADDDECLIMSLIENVARRRRRAVELLDHVGDMKRRGDSEETIAHKIGFTVEYVRGIVRLLESGEHRLLRSVELGQIPIGVAVRIAGCSSDEMRDALQKAYDSGELRGKQLFAARRLIEQRRRSGKGLRGSVGEQPTTLSPATLIRNYRDDVERKRLLVRNAEAAHARLAFIIQAVRKLLADEHFVALLRAEGLETLPHGLVERMRS